MSKERWYEDLEKGRSQNEYTEDETECFTDEDHEWSDVHQTYVFDPPTIVTKCRRCGKRYTNER